MTTFDVRIGINPLSWMNDDLPSLGGETPLDVALTEGRRIGYEGFELGNKFPARARGAEDAARAIRSRAGIGLVLGTARRAQRRGRDRRRRAASRPAREKRRDGHGVWRSGEFDPGFAAAALSASALFLRREVERIRRTPRQVRRVHVEPRRAGRVPSSHGRVCRNAGRCRTPDELSRAPMSACCSMRATLRSRAATR